MSVISVRLSDDLEAILTQEAKASKRAKSEIARTAIADYLKKQERERYMAAYVRSLVTRDPAEALAFLNKIAGFPHLQTQPPCSHWPDAGSGTCQAAPRGWLAPRRLVRQPPSVPAPG